LKLTRYLIAIAVCGVLNACAWRLHEPAATLETTPEKGSWGLHCETAEVHSRSDDHHKHAANVKYLWAETDAREAITLDGHLEDGFFIATEVSTESGEKLTNTRSSLRQLCRDTLTRGKDTSRSLLGKVRAARTSENINLPLVFPEKSYATGEVSRLVIFGDSLSDAGRLQQRMRIFPGPPYWLGRFSNGPVWTDYLEVSTDLAVQNHAYGGASVTDLNALPGEGLIAQIKSTGQIFVSGSIGLQIDDYIANYLSSGMLVSADKTAIVIWAGANDYISKEPITGFISTFLNSPEDVSGYRAVADATIAGLVKEVRKLQASGAKRFVLVNLPDLGRTPIVLQNESYMSPEGADSDDARKLALSERLSQLTRYHNQGLADAVAQLNNEFASVEVVLADTQVFIEQLRGGSPMMDDYAYGFNTADSMQTLQFQDASVSVPRPCYTGGYLGSKDAEDTCETPAQSLFWDIVHPSTAAHCWQAFDLREILSEAGWASVTPPSLAAYGKWCREYDQQQGL
jgi:thermolabile hemolysin